MRARTSASHKFWAWSFSAFVLQAHVSACWTGGHLPGSALHQIGLYDCQRHPVLANLFMRIGGHCGH